MTQQEAPALTNIPVTTEFGTVHLTVDSATQITVNIGAVTGRGLTMYRNEYVGMVLLGLYDGRWELRKTPEGVSKGNSAYIKKKGALAQDAPTTHRAKIISSVIDAANGWVQNNWRLVDIAEYRSIQEHLIQVEGEISIARATLSEKMSQAEALRQRLAACSYQPAAASQTAPQLAPESHPTP